MKKTVAVLAFLALAAPLFADSVSSETGDRLAPWQFRLDYREKYFEYNSVYDAFGFYEDADMLSGMDQDMTLMAGLPGDFFAGAGVKFVFQKVTLTAQNITVNEQEIQAVKITGGKYFAGNSLAVYAGCRIGLPVERTAGVPDGILVDYSQPATAAIAGIKGSGRFWLINTEAGAAAAADFGGWSRLDAYADIGFNWHEDAKKQMIEPALELRYCGEYMHGESSNILWLIPQARIYFYNDLNLIFGVEAIIHADNAYLNGMEKALYTVKISYVINSDKRTAPDASAFGASNPVYITGTAAPLPVTGTSAPVSVTPTVVP
ncbi:MAG: hypothetical protein LLG37_01275 [Spirochaetia bacterium]|nr:hypothetical protein [Spirochaetia bacterium]